MVYRITVVAYVHSHVVHPSSIQSIPQHSTPLAVGSECELCFCSSSNDDDGSNGLDSTKIYLKKIALREL